MFSPGYLEKEDKSRVSGQQVLPLIRLEAEAAKAIFLPMLEIPL